MQQEKERNRPLFRSRASHRGEEPNSPIFPRHARSGKIDLWLMAGHKRWSKYGRCCSIPNLVTRLSLLVGARAEGLVLVADLRIFSAWLIAGIYGLFGEF
jgi:hypothetical protein